VNTVIKQLVLWLAIFSSLFSAAVYAAAEDEIIINYSGTVVIPPCIIDTPAVSVKFDNVDSGLLATAGSTTDWQNFKITLSQCQDNVTGDILTTGTPATDPRYYATTGSAKNIDVEITGDNETILSNGNHFSFTTTAGVMDINLKARLRNNGNGAATPGDLTSMITATFSYK